MSKIHVAKDLERLEEIFYRYHGVNDGRYLEFCEKNIHVIHKDLLDAGDQIHLLEKEQSGNVVKDTRVALWD